MSTRSRGRRTKESKEFFQHLWELKNYLEVQEKEEFSNLIDEVFERFSIVGNLRSIENIQEKILSRLRKNKNRPDLSENTKKLLMEEDRYCINFCNEVISNADSNDEKIAGAKEFVEGMRREKEIS